MRTCITLLFAAILLFAFTAEAQYCMLPGRTPYSNNQPGITSFKLNAINRTSSGVESASTVVVTTNDSTTLVRGQSYTITMTDSYDPVYFPNARNNIRVWIDYNHNYSYDDAGETVLTMNYHSPGTYTGTFTVPMTAPLGNTMLRATVKMSDDAGHTLPTACDSPADPLGYHGEMEDYKIKITSPTSVNETSISNQNLAVFPNPVQNKVTISFDAVENENATISLYDVTGKQAGQLFEGKIQQADPVYQFDLGNYPAGMYIIKLTSGGVSSYRKLVKIN